MSQAPRAWIAAAADGRLERGGAPLGQVAGRDDVDVALEDQGRHRPTRPPGCRRGPRPPPVRLGAGEPVRRREGVAGPSPRDRRRGRGPCSSLAEQVLDVALGVGAADAGDGEQLDQQGHTAVRSIAARARSSERDSWATGALLRLARALGESVVGRTARMRLRDVARGFAGLLRFSGANAMFYRRRMDEIDHQILQLLLRDGRCSYAAIGGVVGLSVSAAKRRVERLVRDGAIRGFTAVVEPQAMGWQHRGGAAALHQRDGAVRHHARRPRAGCPRSSTPSPWRALRTRCCGWWPATSRTSSG